MTSRWRRGWRRVRGLDVVKLVDVVKDVVLESLLCSLRQRRRRRRRMRGLCWSIWADTSTRVRRVGVVVVIVGNTGGRSADAIVLPAQPTTPLRR